MTLDLLVHADLPDEVAVECRRGGSRCCAAGRILAMPALDGEP
jgi:hypothetical protein